MKRWIQSLFDRKHHPNGFFASPWCRGQAQAKTRKSRWSCSLPFPSFRSTAFEATTFLDGPILATGDDYPQKQSCSSQSSDTATPFASLNSDIQKLESKWSCTSIPIDKRKLTNDEIEEDCGEGNRQSRIGERDPHIIINPTDHENVARTWARSHWTDNYEQVTAPFKSGIGF